MRPHASHGCAPPPPEAVRRMRVPHGKPRLDSLWESPARRVIRHSSFHDQHSRREASNLLEGPSSRLPVAGLMHRKTYGGRS